MTLGIAEPRLSDIERAALLHDLGRLALPDALLLRHVSELTVHERSLFREYPAHGRDILKTIPFLAAAGEIAVAAHERCDGSGFPRGLRGDAIPLGARIIGLASAYDALVAVAPGDREVSMRALEVLSTSRRDEFDPAAVAALHALLG
jgi:response regulator RpfG family c-di-GMP phosphodiesterase